MNLDHIEILSHDLNATKRFYEEALGLTIVSQDAESLTIKIGSSLLTFKDGTAKPKAVYHLAFNIPQNKLSEAIEWSKNRIELIKQEEAVLIANFESWNANAVYFYDNNGNLLEFIARKDLDNTQAEVFSSNQLLNISEIGIVTDNPATLGEKFAAEYGLSLFEKNQNSEVFTAVGNDNGLLIIVKTNRNWYPTTLPAKSNWTKIGLTNNAQSSLIEITS
ncbi:VOC family protein [Flavobacterium sp. PLA-1-15]|uniref:VOC family protein n=1 Tax=Flavobacterium sp. PLA-1-15 TaxID=3380533 RepID=UPI003B829032